MILLLSLTIIGLIVIGVPLGFAIISACLVVIWADGGINPAIVAQRLYSGFDSFTLLAIPFFLLAGSLMSESGMTTRLIAFASAVVGRLPGGLAMSNVLASTFFSGISGSAVADTSVMGRVFIPDMERLGYSRSFSVAVTAGSSVVAPIIPPSIGFIVYGVLTDQSIIRLFLAGVIPGVLFSVAALLIVYWVSRQRGYGRTDAGTVSLGRQFVSASPALVMPLLILVGIFSGVFTVTECSAVAVVYALVVGAVVYRELTLAGIVRALRETVHTTAVIMIIVGAAKLFAWQLAYNHVPEAAMAWIQAVAGDPLTFLLLLNVLLLLVGTFMEANAAMVMLVPILHPAGVALGVDPLQLGVIVVVNLCLGLITPPVGLCLNVACKIADLPLEQSIRDILPFVVLGLLVLLTLSLVPAVSLWLPAWIMG